MKTCFVFSDVALDGVATGMCVAEEQIVSRSFPRNFRFTSVHAFSLSRTRKRY